jgi:hypothetical protein
MRKNSGGFLSNGPGTGQVVPRDGSWTAGFAKLAHTARTLCDCSDPKGDAGVLSRWLKSVRAHAGGTNTGNADEVRVVLQAGDQPSNSREFMTAQDCSQSSTAGEWTSQFENKSRAIHTFVAGKRADCEVDFRRRPAVTHRAVAPG